jgi:hypothetical protein
MPRDGMVRIRADAAGRTHEFIDWVTSQRLSTSVAFTLLDDFADKSALIPEGCGHRPTTPTASLVMAPGSPR